MIIEPVQDVFGQHSIKKARCQPLCFNLEYWRSYRPLCNFLGTKLKNTAISWLWTVASSLALYYVQKFWGLTAEFWVFSLPGKFYGIHNYSVKIKNSVVLKKGAKGLNFGTIVFMNAKILLGFNIKSYISTVWS